MRYYLVIFIVFIAFINFVHWIDIESKDYSFWDEITISWDNFWNGGQYDYVCFNNDETCYSASNVSKRSNSEIVVQLPYDIPIKGEIIIYYWEQKRLVRYWVKPIIIWITNDDDELIVSGCPGDAVNIIWVWFWDYLVKWSAGTRVNIGLGNQQTEITDWWKVSYSTASSLWFWDYYEYLRQAKIKIPNLESEVTWFTLWNTAWKSDYYDLFEMWYFLSNDPYWCYQSSYLSNIKANFAWENDYKLWDGITIAVIDDWVNHNNLDLEWKIWNNSDEIQGNWIDDDGNWYIDDIHGWNFYEDSDRMDIDGDHWTMISWIISAIKDNNIWVAWIAPNATIMPIIISKDWNINLDDLYEAIRYAVDNGANVINLSFWWVLTNTYEEKLNEVTSYAYENWAVVIAAAWNGDATNQQDRNLNLYKSSPVCNDHVIWVAAINNDWIKADFSDYGDKCIDISAPGIWIVSTSHSAYSSIGDSYSLGNGTSFSAPMVAGAVALLWSNHPELSNKAIYEIIEKHWDDLDSKNPSFAGQIWKSLNIERLLTYDVSGYETIDDNKNKTQSDQMQWDNTASNTNNNEASMSEIVNWMHNNWLTKYNAVSDYMPNQLITREQASKFYSQFAKVIWLDSNNNSACEFTDISNADYTLLPYIIKSCELWLLKGAGNRFMPFDNITKAQAVTVVIRSLYGFLDEDVTPRYQNYYEQATSLWIIDYHVSEMDEDITRWEMWEIVYKAAGL